MKPQYLVQQPKTLESMALVKFAEWITLQAEKWMSPKSPASCQKCLTCFYTGEYCDRISTEKYLSRQLEILRNGIECNMHRTLHDQLLTNLIAALSKLQDKINLNWTIESHQKNVCMRVAEILFTKRLTTLVIDYLAMLNLKEPLLSRGYMLSGLTRLEFNITTGCLNFITENDIIQSLKSLSNLIHFKIHNVCTNNILRCLVKHCKLVQELDVMSSRDLDDSSVNIMAQLADLKNVNLSGTSVTKWGIIHLLTSCENLEAIDNYWTNEIITALEHIAFEYMKEKVKKQFKLQHYSINMGTTNEQLKLIVQMCPQIQKIEISKDSIHGSVQILQSLQNLQKLVLYSFNFYTDRVKETLQACGSKLINLSLLQIKEVNISSLIQVCQTCPNLESLIITERRTLGDPQRVQNHDIILKIMPFSNLRKLIYYAEESEERSPATELLFMLSNSPNIEFIKTSVPITDDIMLKVLDKNPLIYLEEFKMLRSELSDPVIDRIVQHCINPPIIINYPRFFTADGN